MADDADGDPPADDGGDELDRGLVHAQVVGVADAAGEHEPVVLFGVCVGHGAVDGQRAALVGVVPELDGPILWRKEIHRCAGLLEGLARAREFYSLHAVGGEDGDPLPCEIG